MHGQPHIILYYSERTVFENLNIKDSEIGWMCSSTNETRENECSILDGKMGMNVIL